MNSQLVHIVIEDFHDSGYYRAMRSPRQRIWSAKVLRFVLQYSRDGVRRCEIRRSIVAASPRTKAVSPLPYGDEEAKQNRPLSDHELQRILDRLELARFIKSRKKYPKSLRTKERRKYDLYYSISPRYLRIEDYYDDQASQAVAEAFGKRVDGIATMLGDPDKRAKLAADHLMKTDMANMSVDERCALIKETAKFVDEPIFGDHHIRAYAMKLPPNKKGLRTQLLKHLDEQALQSSTSDDRSV